MNAINYKSLNAALYRVITSQGDSNQTALTHTPSTGEFGISFMPSDLGEGEIPLINRDSLNTWNQGEAWDDNALSICADWVADNLGEWIRNEE